MQGVALRRQCLQMVKAEQPDQKLPKAVDDNLGRKADGHSVLVEEVSDGDGQIDQSI